MNRAYDHVPFSKKKPAHPPIGKHAGKRIGKRFSVTSEPLCLLWGASDRTGRDRIPASSQTSCGSSHSRSTRDGHYSCLAVSFRTGERAVSSRGRSGSHSIEAGFSRSSSSQSESSQSRSHIQSKCDAPSPELPAGHAAPHSSKRYAWRCHLGKTQGLARRPSGMAFSRIQAGVR